ncbi:MAG: hypothetical protein KME23_19105 [Goleter apudmare HA4340-LM2]|nr:hypothetical protein [Goleter apudmare HA4340-LM2]
MSSKFTKRLSTLATILALVFFIPGIALAATTPIHTTQTIILAQATIPDPSVDLTPLQRQELQAVRQRRNREIVAILDSSQRAKLAHNLRHGDDLNQALRTLNLRPEQQDFVKAIMQLTNLKLRAISTRHLLPVGQK